MEDCDGMWMDVCPRGFPCVRLNIRGGLVGAGVMSIVLVAKVLAPNGQYAWRDGRRGCGYDDADVLGGRWVMFSQLITCFPPLPT